MYPVVLVIINGLVLVLDLMYIGLFVAVIAT